MPEATYIERRGELETYFDRTAAAAWARLTSEAPVGRIRASVRAGRDEMRRTLLDYLGGDLRGVRLLDAGCGTGALAVAAARRGARVTAIDLSPTLVELARERLPEDIDADRIDFRVGDLLDPELGEFDCVVAMDSLIHYRDHDIVDVLSNLAARARVSLLFTFAPRTPLLTAMHTVGRLFPRGDRAPAIEPVSPRRLTRLVGDAPALEGWRPGRTRRIASSFYISQALELTHDRTA